jgi:microcystin-dependent protein
LFAAIGGHVFGADPGSGNFLLPNLKGKVVVGFNSTETEFDAIGETGGVKTHALSEAELATHTHAISVSASTGAESSNHGHDQTGIAGYTGSAGLAGGSDYSSLTQETGAQKTGHTHSVSATGSATSVGSGTAHNNLQPYITLKYIIKT